MKNFVPTGESELLRCVDRHRQLVSCQIMETMPTTAGTLEELKAIVMMANIIARLFNHGFLSSCVLTSYALAAVLTDRGYADARPVRVEASISPHDDKLGGVGLGLLPGSYLGFRGPRRRRRARECWWRGHLAVCIGRSWLLDPTLDQVNETKADQWADAGIGVEPVAASLTPEFWDLDLPKHERFQWVHFNGVSARYSLAPQKGFPWLPDARPSHWRPLAQEITYYYNAVHGAERDGFGLKTHSAPAEAT